MSADAAPDEPLLARRWRIGGRVQGVGFRPFVYRIAKASGVAGWVRNSGGIVEVHAQGNRRQLEDFATRLAAQAPPASRHAVLTTTDAAAESDTGFRILHSAADAQPDIHVPPDLFACDECLAELRDPHARRHDYPFINCTQCGPRYTLILSMPYDRPNTTMVAFPMCADCAAEYGNPLDRRFHAQPLACPVCGPRLSWVARDAGVSGNEVALQAAARTLRAGGIVAARGIGGYHLLCDAGREDTVMRLRERKHRPAKPLALMLPWRGDDGLDAVRAIAAITPAQSAALTDPARPIVLLERRDDAPIAAAIAPGLDEVGVMLPYSPLHHLLLDAFGAALVATSGNISGEPVLTDAAEAERRLAGIVDGFLHHDRPIARPADDPVQREIHGCLRPLRLGRGTAPLELALPRKLRRPLLATGAFMKNTIALAFDRRVVISPHIGDLASPRSRDVFERVAHDLQNLYGVEARALVCDAHPDFPNTRWAQRQSLPVHAVWHHHAHAGAVAGEFGVDAPLLCFTWDGVGLGADGSLWGGEALLGRPGHWRRPASLRPFRLPGGERAAREPWRSALGLCWETDLHAHGLGRLADPRLRAAFDRGLNAPATTAVGRLFDGAAALCGVCETASFEGEAPMRLEALARDTAIDALTLPLATDASGVLRSDWAPLIAAMCDSAVAVERRAALFHASLARALVDQAIAVRADAEVTHVGLAGGVFQNRVLTALAATQLAQAGFEVLIPRAVPVNDAAISYGQIIEAMAFDQDSGE